MGLLNFQNFEITDGFTQAAQSTFDSFPASTLVQQNSSGVPVGKSTG